MSEHSIIEGEVDNGWRGAAAFAFYTGEVGVRQRDDFVEMAYFVDDAGITPNLPAEGTIDGSPYRATAVRMPPRKGGAIVITARPTEEAVL